MIWVQALGQEFPHATGVAKGKKQKQKNPQNTESLKNTSFKDNPFNRLILSMETVLIKAGH